MSNAEKALNKYLLFGYQLPFDQIVKLSYHCFTPVLNNTPLALAAVA